MGAAIGSSGATLGAGPLVVAIVGIDGCGKTSTTHGVVEQLASEIRVAALGDVVMTGAPDAALHQRDDIPLSRSARAVGAVAKGLRRPNLYKNLKILEFAERTHVRNYLLAHDPPRAVICDGDPLVNVSAWAAAKYLKDMLAGDDTRLFEMLHYMAGTRRIPLRQLPYYMRHVWQLALANRLHLTRFPFPDMVILLQLSPAVSMERIRARGRPLQTHENEAFLRDLAAGYERVAGLLEARLAVPVVRLAVDDKSPEETVAAAATAVRTELAAHAPKRLAGPFSSDSIEVVATSMSGSFEDQRKVAFIEPAFGAVTDRPVRVHVADSHLDAREIANIIAAGGGRTIVSAGGAGTFNAVLEGCHVDGAVPADLRLAFLRKGSADLIGKVLHVPDDLEAATAAISVGIDAGAEIPADVLAVESIEPDGSRQLHHIVGFGGIGVFGEVPRFTESRINKYYKGFFGWALGDLGPFYVGLALAVLSWSMRRLFRRVPKLVVTMDSEELPAERSVSVILLNGDLGKDFPLGKGMPLGSGKFRAVVLHHRGVRSMLRQVMGSRTGRLLDDPASYDATVRDVTSLMARPTEPGPAYMVNIDGLRMMTRGTLRTTVAGRVALIDAIGPKQSVAGANRSIGVG